MTSNIVFASGLTWIRKASKIKLDTFYQLQITILKLLDIIHENKYRL